MELIAIVSIAIMKGFNVISFKIVQRDFVSKSEQAIYFIGVYSFLQFVFLFLMPPYSVYNFDLKMTVYPIAYSVFYLLGQLALVLAIKAGPVSLTNIINTYQIMVPILVGFILWHDRISIYQGIGLFIFTIDMYLFSKGMTKKDETDKHASIKWLVMAITSSLLIGGAVVFTKQYMLHTDGIKEYLIIYNLIVFLFSTVYIALFKRVKGFDFIVSRKFFIHVAVAAFTQDVANILFMFYVNKMQTVYFFPFIAILNIIAIVLASRIALKEPVRLISKFAIFLSIIAIYLLGLK